ncbi:hypothetical protein L6164_035983 [Bauhinia variegata]|uniref:Uncharacterized protein n=1 Tax=Bauhinia variegata TaxID=167791 RepID=A0ACB9KFL6_BAUVA|nr:hypothetical protein L6164_035983 [Bauhinia variegata]
MGSNLCIPLCAKANRTEPGEGSSFLKTKCFEREDKNGNDTHDFKRKTELEAAGGEACKVRKMTLKDVIEDSPGLTPDYNRRGEFRASRHSKKRVHPSSSQARGSSICEAKDSLILARPVMCQRHHEEDDAKTQPLSLSRSSSGRSVKSVSFILPHTVILYSPDEPEAESREAPVFTPNEPEFSEEANYSCGDSSFSPIRRGVSFDLSPWFIPAADTLPLVSVSSGRSI